MRFKLISAGWTDGSSPIQYLQFTVFLTHTLLNARISLRTGNKTLLNSVLNKHYGFVHTMLAKGKVVPVLN
jgi:hypothetical protein